MAKERILASQMRAGIVVRPSAIQNLRWVILNNVASARRALSQNMKA
jgi:hypothetical protein